MVNIFTVSMFSVYTAVFEQLYRLSMLIQDIKNRTKTVHFSQMLKDLHEQSFAIFNKNGRHPLIQLSSVKKVLSKKLFNIRRK